MEIIGTKPTNKMCGIYCIRNKTNGKTYIGSSKRMLDRFTEHKRLLTRGQHHSKHLQNAFNETGMWNFVYTVIEQVGMDDLTAREDYWIDTNDSTNPNKGYNYIHYGRKHKTYTQRPRTFRTTKYFVVSPTGEVFEVSNLPDFCRANNLDSSAMVSVAKGKIQHSQFWRCWKFDQKPNEITNQFNFVEYWNGLRSMKNKANIKNRNETQHRWIYHISNETENIVVKSIKNFCKNRGLSAKQMYQVANGKRNEWRGWKCYKLPISNETL